MKSPDLNSNRTKKRKNRGFVDLETSSRKHRRAKKRSLLARNQYNRLGKPGEKMSNGGKSFIHICGGSIHYHAT